GVQHDMLGTTDLCGSDRPEFPYGHGQCPHDGRLGPSVLEQHRRQHVALAIDPVWRRSDRRVLTPAVQFTLRPSATLGLSLPSVFGSDRYFFCWQTITFSLNSLQKTRSILTFSEMYTNVQIIQIHSH